ncbi:uncharacterized protein K452DRAFT_219178 [Aplosporella prunicola CBS 121167]|uniref:Large ribosomal subunit protein mL54 n=1 Tax=Aplosporella prunicola CBS 121167 TaxID=1176127 RepID=A0A6A6BTR8_9PEZI|nr:uncharacterized protein K452DRAFT_219178 [Aplosporella prunicola CBS 121167]KAF2146614.1 hypothetical protein K452DRAFT_219178 [Aplosporella prunicola CBS 121167]
MLCPRCFLLRAPRRAFSSARPAFQLAVNANTATAAAPRQGEPDSHTPPAATSTSAAQPFSAPLTPGSVESAKPPAAPVLVQSSVPAGTPLKGLNFLKNKQDPVALEDSEYPAWLWTVLKSKTASKEAETEGDLFSKSKKQRRLAAKRLRKQALLNPDALAPKIPIYEQTVDLPGGDGSVKGNVEAEKARETLTRALRAKRRSQIKEANFLQSMS